MNSDWEALQEFITAEMRKVFSETVVDHAMNPRNVGNMETADGYASISGKRIEIFGKSTAEEMAKAASAPLLGQIPLDPELAWLCDEGNIERYDSALMKNFADSLIKAEAAKTM